MTDHFADDGKPMPTLDLAELLEQNALMPLDDVAAAELRRLHAEVELQKALVAEAQEMTATVCAENEELRYDREELRKIASILEAQERFLGSWHSIVKQAFARIAADEVIMKQALEMLTDCYDDDVAGLDIDAITALQERLK